MRRGGPGRASKRNSPRPMPGGDGGEHGGKPPREVRQAHAEWMNYRPEGHPAWALTIGILFLAWIAFLAWMILA